LGSGRSLSSIAAEVGCSRSAVRAAAIRLRITDRRPYKLVRFWQLHDVTWLRRRYVDDAWTSGQIAAEVGCSPGSVLRALHRAGVALRHWPAADTTLLHDGVWLHARYVDEAMSTTAIAARLGCSPQTVLKALARAGITARRPHRARPSSGRLRADWRLFAWLAAVARLNATSPSVAERWLAEIGVFRPGARRVPKAPLAEGAAAGESVAAIGRRLGVSPHRVQVELMRHRLVPLCPPG
jgi:DNA-binding CsgD family transcriptional regulator